MSQHDFNVANQTFPNTRTDLNSAFAALTTLQSGATAPGTTSAYMFWADTTDNVLKQRNSTDDGWIIRGSLGDTLVLAKSATYTALLADFELLITMDATGASREVDLPAVATVGVGWSVTIKKIDSTTNTVTLDPNSTETIDGETTLVLQNQYDAVTITAGASEWHLVSDSRSTITTQGDLLYGNLSKAEARLVLATATNRLLQTVTATATDNGDYLPGWGDLWTASAAVVGGVELITATEAQAGTDTSRSIPSDMLMYHPLVPVAVGSFRKTAATATNTSATFGHNIGILERELLGQYKIYFSADMATVTTTATTGWYALSLQSDAPGGNAMNVGVVGTASDNADLRLTNASNIATDPVYLAVALWGKVATATM